MTENVDDPLLMPDQQMPGGAPGFEVRDDEPGVMREHVRLDLKPHLAQMRPVAAPVQNHAQQQQKRLVSIYDRHNGMGQQQLSASAAQEEAGLDSQDAMTLMNGESQALQMAVLRMLEKDSANANKDLAKEAEHFSDLLVDALHEVSGGA